jgi:hypothetical protein
MPLDPAEFAQPPDKGGNMLALERSRGCAQEPDASGAPIVLAIASLCQRRMNVGTTLKFV